MPDKMKTTEEQIKDINKQIAAAFKEICSFAKRKCNTLPAK